MRRTSKSVADLLFERFEGEWKRFVSHYRQAMAGLEQELDQLRAAFGDEPVKSMMESSLIQVAWAKGSKVITQKVAGRRPKASQKVAEAVEPKTKAKRKKRRSKRGRKPVVGAISFVEVRELVLEAVKQLAGTQFTRTDVDGILKKQKVKFDPCHTSLVLSKLINGIKKVGTKPRSKGGGAPFNVYEVKGKLALNDGR